MKKTQKMNEGAQNNTASLGNEKKESRYTVCEQTSAVLDLKNDLTGLADRYREALAGFYEEAKVEAEMEAFYKISAQMDAAFNDLLVSSIEWQMAQNINAGHVI